MRRGLSAALILVLAPSCALADPAGPSPYIDGVSGETERAAVTAWMDETRAVLASDRFRANLAATGAGLGPIYFRQWPDQPEVTGTVAELQALLDLDPPGHRWVPVATAVVGGTGNFDAYSGWTGFADETGSRGSLTLGRGHLARWLSENPLARSCAINTLAHELSHSLSTHPSFFNQVFTDAFDVSRNERPVASYLIGTVAQCTWLEQTGALGPGGLSACVATFGTGRFNSLACEAPGG